MPDTVSTLDLARRFRRAAQETTQPLFSLLMLRAAEELEEYIDQQGTAVASHPRQRRTG